MSVFVSANCHQKQTTVMRNFYDDCYTKTQWCIHCEVCFYDKCDTIESHLNPLTLRAFCKNFDKTHLWTICMEIFSLDMSQISSNLLKQDGMPFLTPALRFTTFFSQACAEIKISLDFSVFLFCLFFFSLLSFILFSKFLLD